MTNVLLGLLLWGFAAADIFVRQRGKEVAARYGMRWLNMPPVMTFLMVAAGAGLIMLGIRGA